jgi:hypothetical protein
MLLWRLRPHLRVLCLTFVTAAVLVDFSDAALAVARTPTISGHSWVALLIIGVLVVVIYMLIRGTLHVEQRDSRMSGGRRARDNGWYGIFPAGGGDDEEDAPDYHHHHGGDGGDGGEGGS